jgi:putative colanic acid biosynthesis UDP-glucose lipid carrier transferase
MAQTATEAFFPVGLALPSQSCVAPAGAFVLKRAFDIGAACIGLLLSAPLLCVIARVIKGDSPGDILFRQVREGYRRRHFTILKFRTMRQEAQPVFEQARRSDRRVTRVGAYLRAASFDELPQLWNILTGTLSLVGPRPHVPELSQRFAPYIEGYYERLDVLPGLTGLAQISGCRGETETLAKMAARIECDRRYVRNNSFLGDLTICINTMFIPLGHDGAY